MNMQMLLKLVIEEWGLFKTTQFCRMKWREDFHKRGRFDSHCCDANAITAALSCASDCSLGSYMSFTYWISATPCQYITHTHTGSYQHLWAQRQTQALPLSKRKSFTKAEQKQQLMLWKERPCQSLHTKEQTRTLWTCIALKLPQMMSFLCAYINIWVCLSFFLSLSVLRH